MQGPDIPSLGSSLFDKSFSKTLNNGDVVYQVDFPLKKLIEKIGRKGNTAAVHSMLPFSRSLQRPGDGRYDPLNFPRLVFSFKHTDHSLERAKMFIGYVKKTDQLEVISYNDEAGRFEYQIVKDYSKNPKVFYVNRGKCLSCHQGQAPIFSVPGWNDTNAGVLGRLLLIKAGIKDHNSESAKLKLKEKLFGKISSHDAVGNFDALVRESNAITRDERVWALGCGKINKCRLSLLMSSLAPNSESSIKLRPFAKKVIAASEFASQFYYSSFLLPTDMGAMKIIKENSNTGNSSAYENTVNNPLAIKQIVNNIYRLPERLNPATPRPREFNEDILFPRSLAGFTQYDRAVLNEEKVNVEKILNKMFQKNNPIFDDSAINKPFIMSEILKEAQSDYSTIYEHFLNKTTPKKELLHEARIPVFRNSNLNIFSRHCSACHATGFAFPPQFLLGSESDVLEKMRALKSKLIYKLSNSLMPPNKSDRDYMIESGDRDTILSFIEKL